MQYKTIILELIEQRPTLHDQLASNDCLLSTMDQLAEEFRTLHLQLVQQLRQTQPKTSTPELKSQALEIALPQIEAALEMLTPNSNEEVFSLDEAMAFVRQHIPE